MIAIRQKTYCNRNANLVAAKRKCWVLKGKSQCYDSNYTYKKKKKKNEKKKKTLVCWTFFPRLKKSLRKHAYSNILKFLPPKNENFQMKNSDNLHISAQIINCGYSLEPPRRGGSNEYPQTMFLSRNKKNNVYPCKPQFYYIKVGFKGVKII